MGTYTYTFYCYTFKNYTFNGVICRSLGNAFLNHPDTFEQIFHFYTFECYTFKNHSFESVYIRPEIRGVRVAEKESAWAARVGKSTCRSACINLLFGFLKISLKIYFYTCRPACRLLTLPGRPKATSDCRPYTSSLHSRLTYL